MKKRPETAESLPILGHSGRSAMTCAYRCGSACAREAPNTSDNPYFGDILDQVLSRRGFLKLGAAAAIVLYAGARPSPAGAQPARNGGRRSGLTFEPVPPNDLDDMIVPSGYDYNVVVRWGDPILPGAPEFDFENQTAEAQSRQFGYNCDYVAFFPLSRRGRESERALLVVNHEYTNSELMFRDFDPEGTSQEDLERIQIELMAHGISVVEIRRRRQGGYEMVRSRRYNRRITAQTPMELTGPAAGHPWLRTSTDPEGRTVLGCLNNCAGGHTPWGTYLSGEENFNQYFVNAGMVEDRAKRESYERYGFGETLPPFGYRGWERTEERFDLAEEPNEGFRFGYVVEVDPFDPDFTPRKRTALGRFKHEGAETTLSRDGRPVAYMGDDERFDYIYKFVSSRKMAKGNGPRARKHNLTLLDHGTLYVARFSGDSPQQEIDGSGELPSDGAFDGTGEWVPLVSGEKSFVPGMSAAEVLINTRVAADKVGATKMDRPEDIERNPVNGRVYAALTNNTRRGAPGNPGPDEANPRTDNKHGHVLEISEEGDDPAATRFTWKVFLLCGDPDDSSTYFAGFDKSQVSPISSPDNVTFDERGNLWIASDSARALPQNDGFFAVPVEGPERGYLRQFLTVPFGAEACGPRITPDERTIFCAVQHPGEVDGASPDDPASRWPDGEQPRPSVVSVFRQDRGRIGS
ncbi:PhoX family phosphatase [Rubrobacter taiwanensis]|jgi:secreted PhoX family phosphatase|uniref:PhoX family phosphatase n=1 Tax=Rubrobacter taiwanensis TaxID=185139 RepID=A0A4R1B9Q4_9ACTN|nr:PhoX family phosphatase [Rubrobacter taiwanensis]TCJ13656.1 PhoX family phosphatase [Rubrobacter taiwanensis]